MLEKHPASASCKASPLITSPPEFCTTRAQSFSYFCLTYPARESKKSKECITGDLDSLLWESDDLSDDWRARFGQYCRYFDKNKTKEIKNIPSYQNIQRFPVPTERPELRNIKRYGRLWHMLWLLFCWWKQGKHFHVTTMVKSSFSTFFAQRGEFNKHVFNLCHVYIILIIIHQIFSLAHNWSKRVMWLNIPQLKLWNICEQTL